MSSYKILVLDFDGTLVDSNSIKSDGFFEVVGHSETSRLAMKEALSLSTGTRQEIFLEYCRIINEPPSHAYKLIKHYSALVNHRVSKAIEIDGACNFLEKLRALSIKIVLSSSTPYNDLLEILKIRNWLSKFDKIFGSPNKKEIIIREKLLPLVNNSKEIAIVGDGEDDFQSAWKNGCEFFPVGEARGYRKNGGVGEIYTFNSLEKIFSNMYKIN